MKEIRQEVEAMIYTIRGQRVILDSDLARLYGVEVKRLNEQVKRNIERFPADFMIYPNSSELASLRSQIATLGNLNTYNLDFKYVPKLFTENGVAMLSSVLKSKTAIQINISIMRTFTKLRSFHSMETIDKLKLDNLEKETNTLFKVVFERLDNINEVISTKLPKTKRKIGLKN